MFYFWLLLSAFLSFSSESAGQYVETIAGSGLEGSMDGRGSEARFNLPSAIELDSSGTIYVCDAQNHRIRKISPLGDVTTIAGNGQAGYRDGSALTAQFNSPFGLTVDSDGNIYVVDTSNNRIRKISTLGEVTTFSGAGRGSVDGNSTTSRFDRPRGIALDASGNLYVADTGNNRIRKVFQNGTVTTVAGSGTPGFLDGSADTSRFYEPRGITIDPQGNIYVADFSNFRIRKISSGLVSTLAGAGVSGDSDGRGTSATFSATYSIKIDTFGVLYVTESKLGTASIRRVTAEGEVTTLLGTHIGFTDGLVFKAQFEGTAGLSLDRFGNIYVGDHYNNRIRKIILPQNIAYNIPSLLTQSVLSLSTNSTGEIVTHTIDGNESLLIGLSSTNNHQMQLFDPEKVLIYEGRRMITNNTSFNQTWGLIVKLTSNYKLIWAQCIGGSDEAYLNDVAFSTNGNVYVIGSYTGTVSFFNQLQNQTDVVLHAVGPTRNGYIVKYASNGTFIWAVTIHGSPSYLTVETWNDSPIVTVKFARQITTEPWPCVIVPTSGETLFLSAVNYGMAVIRFSPDGRIEWSRVLNFAPWEQKQSLSISQFGEISLTGWCFLICQLYEGNETTSKYVFPSPNSGNNAVNIVLSINGSLQSWSPISKYIPIRGLNNRFSCEMGVKNSTATVLSYGNQTLLELKRPALLNIVAVNEVAFVAIDKQQRIVIRLTEFSEFLFDLNSASVAWTSCGRFDSILGPQKISGNLQNGTFMFQMDSQVGFVSEFSFPSNLSDNILVRFRPVGRFSFQCGLLNGTHAYFVSIRSGVLEASLLLVSLDRSSWEEVDVHHNFNVGDVSFSLIAFTIVSDQITFYKNGVRLFDFHFVNTSKFLFTTIDSEGLVDMMAIMASPLPLEPWLINPDSVKTSDEFLSALPSDTNLSPEVATQVQPNPTSTNETTSQTIWSLFGLSGTLLYIVLGASGFFVLIVVAITLSALIIVTKRRRRLKEGLQNATVTFTAAITNASDHDAIQNNTANQTLVNTEISRGLKEQLTR